MVPSTLPKCKITYVYRNQNKSANKKTQTDIAKNKTRYDAIQGKQLELRTTEKELSALKLKLQEKVRKYNQKAKEKLIIQCETERKIDDTKKELECRMDAAIKTDNFCNAPENITFCEDRKNPFKPCCLFQFENQRRSEYDSKKKRVPLQGKLCSSKSSALPVFKQVQKENTKIDIDELKRSSIVPNCETITTEWYNALSPGDNYQVWRKRYKSKCMPQIDHVTVQQILLYSFITVVCSPCLIVLILSSCFLCPHGH